jgi:O-succinylbenzoate synthase
MSNYFSTHEAEIILGSGFLGALLRDLLQPFLGRFITRKDRYKEELEKELALRDKRITALQEELVQTREEAKAARAENAQLIKEMEARYNAANEQVQRELESWKTKAFDSLQLVANLQARLAALPELKKD